MEMADYSNEISHYGNKRIDDHKTNILKDFTMSQKATGQGTLDCNLLSEYKDCVGVLKEPLTITYSFP